MKKPFVNTKPERIDEIVTEINRLKEERNKAKAIAEKPYILSNPPAAYIMQECEEKIQKLQAKLKEELKSEDSNQ